MSNVTVASIETIPQLFMLVTGILGLIFSITGRRRGVSGLLVGAFAVLVFTEVGSLIWNFVSMNSLIWVRQYHLSVDELNAISMAVGLPLALTAAVSWLLVMLAVVRTGRRPQPTTPANYYGPANYPMAAPPGFVSPQPTYVQPTYAQPDYVQPEPVQPAPPQPAHPQPDHVQPEPVEPAHPQPAHPRPEPVQPERVQPNFVQPEPLQPGPSGPTSAPTQQPPTQQPPNQQPPAQQLPSQQ